MKLKILIFSLIFSTLYAGIVNAQLRTFTSGQVGTSPQNGYLLQTNGVTSTWIATSSLGISTVETDPIFGAWFLNPILTSLTTTNFFATNTLFINATTTNLEVGTITHYGQPFNIFTDSALNEGDINIHAGNVNNRDISLYGVPKIFNPNDVNGFAALDVTPLNAGQSYSFQNKTGILAMTDDNVSQFTNDAGYITNAGEIDPIWTAFLADPIFTSLTSTNAYISNLTFVNATSTNITSTNGFFNSLFMNTSTKLGSFTQQGISGVDPIRVMSSTGSQMFAVKSNGQVVVGANSLSQTGQLTIETPTTNDVALSFTNGVHYTFQLGRVAGTSGQAFIGGPVGTSLNLRAGGTDRIFILNTNGYVGVNSTTPYSQFVVVGTSTLDGLTIFGTASGTSITSTNGFFTTLGLTNLTATSITSTNANLTGLTFGTASGVSLTSTNAFYTNLSFTNATGTSISSTNLYVSSKAMIGTTTNTYALNVGGYVGSDRYYTANPNSYITADGTTGITIAGGNTTINTGYLYAATAGTSFYVQGGAVFRGALSNDTGANLTLNGGTSGNTQINNTLTFVSATGTSLTSTSIYNVGGFFQSGLGDCDLDTQTLNYDLTTGKFSCLTDGTGGGGSSEQRVMTSTANYFTFYTSSTAVTGTPWVTFANGALTVTTNTNFTIISSTSALFGNATTTNLYTSNLVLNGTTVDPTALLNSSQFFYLSAIIQACYNGQIIFSDDSTLVCSNDFTFNSPDFAANTLNVNGLVSSTALTVTGNVIAGGTVSGTTGIFGTLTVGSLSLSSLTIVSTTINSDGITTNNAIINYIRPVEGSTLSKPLMDRDMYPVGTAVANTYAFYSDDDTRWLVCSNVAGTGAISLKNTNLTPANTVQSAFYSSGGVLQTITAATLFGGNYTVRSCFTYGGYHYVLGVSTTAATNKVWLKTVTSSYAVSLATAGNWRTVNWTTNTPSTSIISIAGVTRLSGVDKIIIVSSSTKLVPATFTVNASTSTITPDNSITCTTAGSHTIGNTRALQYGYVVGAASAPFNTLYDTGCGATTYNGSFGQTTPASTGPDLAVTKCSIYSLQGTYLFRRSGYTGC